MLFSVRVRKSISNPFLFSACLVWSGFVSAKTLVFQQDESSPQPSAQVAPQVTTYATAPVGQASGNSELFFMLDQLQQEVRYLRGVVEEQAHQIHQLQQSARSRYKDLDSRVLNLSKEVSGLKKGGQVGAVVQAEPVSSDLPASPSSNNPKPVAAVTIADPQQKKAYQDAYAYIKEKQFEQAIDALHAFLEKYPEGELAGNAYYWLGEVYLVLPQLEQARQSFSIVIRSFPNHRKVADALFKLGVTYDRLQDPAQSEQYLIQVQKAYPNSSAAKLAKSYKINR